MKLRGIFAILFTSLLLVSTTAFAAPGAKSTKRYLYSGTLPSIRFFGEACFGTPTPYQMRVRIIANNSGKAVALIPGFVLTGRFKDGAGSFKYDLEQGEPGTAEWSKLKLRLRVGNVSNSSAVLTYTSESLGLNGLCGESWKGRVQAKP